MAIEIKLPELGEGIDSGDVLEVLVSEGDTVEKEQGIVELETDKATVEVPSTHAGKVSKVHVKSGATVSVGDVLISVESEETADEEEPPEESGEGDAAGEKKGDKEKKRQPEKDKKKGKKQVEEPAEAESAGEEQEPEDEESEDEQSAAEDDEEDDDDAPSKAAKKGTSKGDKKDKKKEQKAAKKEKAKDKPGKDANSGHDENEAPDRKEPSPKTPAPRGGGETEAAIAAGPAIRRFAREVGVDLAAVEGSGEGGRITREDVLAVVRRGTTPSREASGEQDEWGPIRKEKMARIRRTIASKMHQSWETVPRVTNFDDADVTDLEEFRGSSKDDYAARGIKLTSLPFVIKSVAMAIKRHPLLNASIDMESGEIIYKEYVNVGVAVDTDRGLIVPVLRGVDDLAIPEIAGQLAEIAEKVRDNDYAIEDLRGATFTVSNLGAVGGRYSTPIVNVPEVAVLLVGRSRKQPAVVKDVVVPRLMMPLSLSYDHRLVDGAAAGRFLNDVIGFLQAPSRLLLAP